MWVGVIEDVEGLGPWEHGLRVGVFELGKRAEGSRGREIT